MSAVDPLPANLPTTSATSDGPSTLAWALGLAGLLPFLAGAALQCFGAPGWRMLAASALLTYGAVIVSFLGGIHWGLAMGAGRPPSSRLVWGVVPSLLGWVGVLLDSPWGPGVLVASLLACYGVDRRSYRDLGLAAWLPLRAVLTTVASLSVAVAGVAAWLA